jgi:hypothetical protein
MSIQITSVGNMKDGSSPVREIAHLIAKILAARPTPSDEIPGLVASVRDTVMMLRAGLGDALPPKTAEFVAAAKPVAPNPPRRRRRKIAAAPSGPEITRRSEPEPVIQILPRLMRRAEVAPVPEPLVFEIRPVKDGTLRGVVRWFDLHSRQGSLRLPGFGDEVAIDSAVLDRAGISRLYKGQEIEATVSGDNGSVHLVSLALPGRAEPAANGLFKAGAARRNAKPVVVELKRDAMRRTAARIEAEHLLGNGRAESAD